MNPTTPTTFPVAQPSPVVLPPNSDSKTTALLGVYEQVCNSHQAIDEFRMKLLGLLPLASLAGIFLLGKSDSILDFISGTSDKSNHLIAFIAIFAAIFTLALFVYEIRGILRCHGLIKKGKIIEKELKIDGQFSLCDEEHESGKSKNDIFNSKVAACFIYSLVFAAWIFLALHRGFGIQIHYCAISAPLAGLILGFAVYWTIDELIPA